MEWTISIGWPMHGYKGAWNRIVDDDDGKTYRTVGLRLPFFEFVLTLAVH